MPWCPKCRTEYEEGFSKCSDCESELVDFLEEEVQEEVEYDTEVFLTSVKDEIEFNIIEAKLNQYGIPVMKKHKESGGYLSVYMGMTPFGIDIYVPSKVLETAKKVIMNNEGAYAEVGQEPAEDIKEEECLQNMECEYDRKRRYGAWIIILFFVPGLVWAVFQLIQLIVWYING